MSAALQKLDFMVSLIDRVSGPAGKVMKTMDKVTTNIQGGMRKVGYGAAGLAGVGFALNRLLEPAKKLDRAFGELKSLGVAGDALDSLKLAAVDFTNTYGGAADEFIRSSYDIQSAIGGLSGSELTDFTVAGATLAKATKSDMGTVTDYIGTMYNIFEKTANKMGKAQWVAQLAGQTATAVQMFKTTGDKLSASFMNVGGIATEMGVSMAEQYAVIGQLSGTLTGERAGTAYKAILQNMGKAQKALGVSLEDAHGNALPMADVLDKINVKIAGMGAIARSNALTNIFGGQKAVEAATLLLNSTESIRKNTELLGKQTGLQKAIAMASEIADPFERAEAQVTNLQAAIGGTLMPVIADLLGWFGELAISMGKWVQQYPEMTKYIGYAGLAIAGVVAGLSLMSIAVGMGSILMAGWAIVSAPFTAALWLANGGLTALIPKVWLYTSALLANPTTWIVVGIVALGAALVALVVYWDDISAAVGRFFDKISSLSGIKDVLTGLIPDFILKYMGVDATAGAAAVSTAVKPIAPPAGLNNSPQAAAVGGGVMNRISNATSNNNSKQVGAITVNNYGQAMSGQTLADELEFSLG